MSADTTELLDRTSRIEDRCTRIETRLTKFLESQGFETHVRRPFWNGKAVVAPSMSCALQDLLAAIPEHALNDDDAGVPVIHQGKTILYLYPTNE